MKVFIITCLVALSGLSFAQTPMNDTEVKPSTVTPTPGTSDSMDTEAQKEVEKKRLEEKEEADELESGKTEESPDMGTPSTPPTTVP
jgi:hypothetical protein